jgi:hypothetical protein
MVVTEITNDIAGAPLAKPSSRLPPAHSAVDGAAIGFDSADRRRQRFSARDSLGVWNRQAPLAPGLAPGLFLGRMRDLR